MYVQPVYGRRNCHSYKSTANQAASPGDGHALKAVGVEVDGLVGVVADLEGEGLG